MMMLPIHGWQTTTQLIIVLAALIVYQTLKHGLLLRLHLLLAFRVVINACQLLVDHLTILCFDVACFVYLTHVRREIDTPSCTTTVIAAAAAAAVVLNTALRVCVGMQNRVLV